METREAIERVHQAEHLAGPAASPERLGTVLVAVLAALLALASVLGRRNVAHMLLYQEQAIDANNLAESNAIKRQISEGNLGLLRVFATDEDTAQAANQWIPVLERDIAETYVPNEERFAQRAHVLDKKRDRAEARYEAFELAETVSQMAIVFTTIAVTAHSSRLMWASVALGGVAFVLLLAGFLNRWPF